jgi:hypothetical protein
MRRTVLIAAAAAVGGYLLASVAAYGLTERNIWNIYGQQFQLGYVVGYLEAVTLYQRHDRRAMIPTGGGKNFDRWVRDVNAYLADPANEKRSVPDAMGYVGNKIRDQWAQDWMRRSGQLPSPSASPSPEQ